MECTDRLEDLPTRLTGRDLDIGRFADGAGRPRVTVPVPDWDRHVRTGVDDLLFAAAASPMAPSRMRDLLGRLLERAPEDRRAVVRDVSGGSGARAATRIPSSGRPAPTTRAAAGGLHRLAR
ncbi:hypothetical protein ACWFQ8_32990 [Streptomyces sp. NPDC055254]